MPNDASSAPGSSWLLHPRPMYGIVVAVMVRNWTLVSSGSEAMYSTASATCRGSKTGSTATHPLACGMPRVMGSVMSVAALPMSICPQAMSKARPSRDSDLVSPVIACLVAV